MNIRNYTEDRLKKIRQSLTHFEESGDPEALHEFRVEIKKLKMLYELIHISDPTFHSDKKFRVHRDIFRRSGKIRDLIVIQELAKKYTLVLDKPTFSADSWKRRNSTFLFLNQIPVYLEELKNTTKDILRKTEIIKKDTMHFYLKKEKLKIDHLLNHDPNKTDLHTIRKTCKKLIYLSKTDHLYTAETISYYEQLQEAIGAWHDKMILIRYIKKHPCKNIKEMNSILKRERKQDRENIFQVKHDRSI